MVSCQIGPMPPRGRGRSAKKMLGPLVPVGAPYVLAQHARRRMEHGDEVTGADAGVGGLLADMADTVDNAECYLLLGLLLNAVSLCVTLVIGIFICVSPRVPTAWYWVCSITGILFCASLALILEPRPMHWLPSLERGWQTLRRCSPSECKARVRRWWRWRTKYSARTKLNV